MTIIWTIIYNSYSSLLYIYEKSHLSFSPILAHIEIQYLLRVCSSNRLSFSVFSTLPIHRSTKWYYFSGTAHSLRVLVCDYNVWIWRQMSLVNDILQHEFALQRVRIGQRTLTWVKSISWCGLCRPILDGEYLIGTLEPKTADINTWPAMSMDSESESYYIEF